jgi:hypothetical protein
MGAKEIYHIYTFQINNKKKCVLLSYNLYH